VQIAVDPALSRSRVHPFSRHFAQAYREMFERGKRKDDEGKFVEWTNALLIEDKINPLEYEIHPRPIIDLKFPFYLQLEAKTIEAFAGLLKVTDQAILQSEPTSKTTDPPRGESNNTA
jgi:hypothetical protein